MFLGMLSPSRPSSLGSHSLALCLAHSLEPPFPADLTAFAPYGSHILGNASRLVGWLGWFFGNLACRTVYDPFGELVRIAWALAFSDSHAVLNALPKGCAAGCLERRRWGKTASPRRSR